jgi:hypothetical protein
MPVRASSLPSQSKQAGLALFAVWLARWSRPFQSCRKLHIRPTLRACCLRNGQQNRLNQPINVLCYGCFYGLRLFRSWCNGRPIAGV